MRSIKALTIGMVLLWCLPAWADIGWFVAPYLRKPVGAGIGRYCAMDDFTSTIRADGGDWREVEILGDKCLVKVKASAATLAALNAAPGFVRLPKDSLDDTLASLTTPQKTALRNFVLGLGYTAQELQDQLGTDLGLVTLRQLVRFLATRRLKPRFDPPTQTIILDGPVQPTGSIDRLDQELQ